jgi:toxin ParE1/3/4
MTRIIRRPAAKQDLIEQADYIARNDLRAAYRFLDAVEETFALLSKFPEIGKSRKVHSRVFANVRQFPITGFEKYLVFYRPSKLGLRYCESCMAPAT